VRVIVDFDPLGGPGRERRRQCFRRFRCPGSPSLAIARRNRGIAQPVPPFRLLTRVGQPTISTCAPAAPTAPRPVRSGFRISFDKILPRAALRVSRTADKGLQHFGGIHVGPTRGKYSRFPQFLVGTVKKDLNARRPLIQDAARLFASAPLAVDTWGRICRHKALSGPAMRGAFKLHRLSLDISEQAPLISVDLPFREFSGVRTVLRYSFGRNLTHARQKQRLILGLQTKGANGFRTSRRTIAQQKHPCS